MKTSKGLIFWLIIQVDVFCHLASCYIVISDFELSELGSIFARKVLIRNKSEIISRFLF